eukprot:scaffold156299_cov15-Prasinocladus_malaysianus.AAC.1
MVWINSQEIISLAVAHGDEALCNPTLLALHNDVCLAACAPVTRLAMPVLPYTAPTSGRAHKKTYHFIRASSQCIWVSASKAAAKTAEFEYHYLKLYVKWPLPAAPPCQQWKQVFEQA